MEINKLQVEKAKFDINLKFYIFLKYLTKSKLSDRDNIEFLKIFSLFKSSDYKIIKGILDELVHGFKGDKKDLLFVITEQIENSLDIELFKFTFKLLQVKELLLEEAKIGGFINYSRLTKLNPLSLEYDRLSVFRPYATRVNGALLALLFFEHLEKGVTNFMSNDSFDYLTELSTLAINLTNKGLEPNQIFMLMFTESVNQKIISESGKDYEDRILSVLLNIGISREKIVKTHDKNDASTEFDFFFDLGDRTYGIGAKRTLRERYKQFIKTTQMSKIDVMIEITLGLDLNEDKARTIIAHNVYLFVSDEVYSSRDFLQKLDGVYSVKDLNLNTLRSLR